MSRAFVKDEGPEGPPVVPPRAPLPAGVTNYVTPRGLALLRAELAELEAERARLNAGHEGEAAERKRRLAIVNGRLADLAPRIASARLVDPREQAHDEVRFGAAVRLLSLGGPQEGQERRIQIVGVDEADAATGRVAFLAPIARAVLGLRVGDVATLRTGRGEEELEVLSVEYPAD